MQRTRIKSWWLGPVSVEDQHTVALGPGSVTVQAIQEAIGEAQEILRQHASTGAAPNGLRTSIHLNGHGSQIVDLEDLSSAGEVAMNEMSVTLNLQGEMTMCGLDISRLGCRVSFDAADQVSEIAARAARASIVNVLAHDMERRSPSWRLYQALGVAVSAVLLAVWVWAMTTTSAPIAVWCLSLVGIAAPIWLITSSTWRRARDARLSLVRIVTVDSTPRDELRARRFNSGENRKQRWATGLITAPIGIIIGAVVTALLLPER